MTMIQLKNISVTFNKQALNPIEVLKSVSLSFDKNEWTFIIGGNGSGKSTLLKVINQGITPDNGSVIYRDLLPQDVLLVDQATVNNVIPAMTIYENLVFAFSYGNTTPTLRFYRSTTFKRKIMDVLSEFNLGLESRLDEQVRFLSGGEQQIIVASRIMLCKPKFLLMDEFTSALDQKWGPFILNKLKSFATDNEISIIAVTHDYNQIEPVGDRVLLLKDGLIFKDVSSSEEILTRNYILSIFYGEK